MQHDPKAYLFDIKQAFDEIEEFTQGMSFEQYCDNSLVKAAVEREFLVIGEAMARFKKEHPEILSAPNEINRRDRRAGAERNRGTRKQSKLFSSAFSAPLR